MAFWEYFLVMVVLVMNAGHCQASLLGPSSSELEEPEKQHVEIDHKFNATFLFYPSKLDGLIAEEMEEVEFTVYSDHEEIQDFVLSVRGEDPEIAVVPDGSRIIRISPDTIDAAYAKNYTIPVKGVFLGRTKLVFSVGSLAGGSLGTEADAFPESVKARWNKSSLEDSFSIWTEVDLKYNVAVIRRDRLVDTIFIGVVSVAVFFSKIGMGCKIDIDVVKGVLRRPVPLVIGFVCQFTIMPTVAFALSKAVGLEGGQALGLFASGCAPGGGASNMYTYLLHGDVSLSVTMTLVSVTASLGMIPLWLLTLGQKILQSGQDGMTDVEIPFTNILLSLISFLCPIGIGILIQKKKPSLSKKIVRVLRPFFLVFIVFMFSFGFYSNLYLFKLFTPQLVLAGMLLPWTGFVMGGFCATVFRQPRIRIIAIAVETGIQNVGIPLLLLKYSLPQPEADLSVIAPVIIIMFTPIPLWFAIAGMEIRKRCCKAESDSEKEEGLSKCESEEVEETVFLKGGEIIDEKDASSMRNDEVKITSL